MWGIIPAAGQGSRIQPLAFSKELLPVGRRSEGEGTRPRAVSDYLIERLVIGGAMRLCFVISPTKSDIIEYYGGSAYSAAICYCVQPKPTGLCDSIFRAVPFIDPAEPVMIGLPDTIWFPSNALLALPDNRLSFLLFPVEQPEYFDAVVMDSNDRVIEIQVKQPGATSRWIWGAFKMPGAVLQELFELWKQRDCVDEYFGTLINAWVDQGGEALGFRAGSSYLDVGTMDRYLKTIKILSEPGNADIAAQRGAL
jgi:glucose-1-phosphate thymidylyltransferase